MGSYLSECFNESIIKEESNKEITLLRDELNILRTEIGLLNLKLNVVYAAQHQHYIED
jgi:hypothetical protein